MQSIEAVGAPEHILRRHAPVASTHPENDTQDVHSEPYEPVFAIDKNHQYLRHQRGYCCKGVKIRLRVIRPLRQPPSGETGACQHSKDDDRHQPRTQLTRRDDRRGPEPSAPYLDAVYHRQEIIGIDGYLAVKTLRDTEPCVCTHLRKAEQKREDVSLRRQTDRADAKTTAYQADNRGLGINR